MSDKSTTEDQKQAMQASRLERVVIPQDCTTCFGDGCIAVSVEVVEVLKSCVGPGRYEHMVTKTESCKACKGTGLEAV